MCWVEFITNQHGVNPRISSAFGVYFSGVILIWFFCITYLAWVPVVYVAFSVVAGCTEGAAVQSKGCKECCKGRCKSYRTKTLIPISCISVNVVIQKEILLFQCRMDYVKRSWKVIVFRAVHFGLATRGRIVA